MTKGARKTYTVGSLCKGRKKRKGVHGNKWGKGGGGSVTCTKVEGKCRLRAVSLFSWSVEQNARDTQMTTRVTEGPRRERLPPSFLASSPLNAHARALPLLNLKKKRDCSQSRESVNDTKSGKICKR